MKNISRIASLLLTVAAMVLAVSAQSESISSAAADKYIISAKAGGVNFVEGTVGIVRKSGRSGILLKGDRIEIGDQVSTAADGKVEILLNPGSYLRLGGGASFEFGNTSLDDLLLKIGSGSAILEVFAANDFTVTVNAPNAKFTAIESGVYRIDVNKGTGSRIEVWKGMAEAGTDATIVKKGREAEISGTQVAVAKFDSDEKDSLDIWSKQRAKELAKASASLTRRTLQSSLASSFSSRSWNMYDSFGLWVFNPSRGGYCFLPFGYGWYSPYGYGFGQSIYFYNLPQVYQQAPTGRGVSTQKTGAPPYVRMQGTSGVTGRDISNIKIAQDGSIVRSAPVFVPSSTAAPVSTGRIISTTKPRP